MQKIVNLENLKAMNEVFKRLNMLRRWTSVTSDPKYNELAKQALNCITAYMLSAFAEEHGHIINWERFPRKRTSFALALIKFSAFYFSSLNVIIPLWNF